MFCCWRCRLVWFRLHMLTALMMLMLQLLDDDVKQLANDVNWDNNVVSQADNVSVVGEDTDESTDIVIDAKPSSFNDGVEEITYSFKVYK